MTIFVFFIGCPPDFVAIGDGCYIVQTHAVYATYDEISAHCNQRGANLASLETEMEFYLIRDYIIYVFCKRIYLVQIYV